MFEVIVTAAIILLGAACALVATRSADSIERKYVRASLAMHFVFAFALRFSQGGVFSEGDLGTFQEGSKPLLDLLNDRFFRWAPEILLMMFRMKSDLGGEHGDPTLSMYCVTAFGRYFTLDSFHALYCALAFFSFLGKWGIYAAFRDNVPLADKRPLLLATMFLPSVVFWTSGLVKETFALIGIGALVYGSRNLIERLRTTAVVLMAVGAALVGTFKPYFLFPFVVGLSIWLFFTGWKRARAFSPIYLVVGVVLAYGLVVALGVMFPQYAPGHFAEQVAEQQLEGERGGGGSYYHMGDAKATTLSAQLVYAPLALVTTLARPALFEAHNFTSAIASLEMTVLTFFLVRAVFRGGMRVLRHVIGTPILIFAFAFTVLAATGVGLATSNFGTLSRYRVPIMPFYAVLVVVSVHQTRLARRMAPLVRRGPRLPVPREAVRERALGGLDRRRR